MKMRGGLIGGLMDARENKVADGDETQLVCPHCQTRGSVTRSGGYARKTRSVLATTAPGLLRWDTTQMHCSNCGTDWTV